MGEERDRQQHLEEPEQDIHVPIVPTALAQLERWLQRLTREHGERILPVDRCVAQQGGRFSAARNRSPVDVLMAATAMVHELVLVTRNTRVACLDPFEARE